MTDMECTADSGRVISSPWLSVRQAADYLSLSVNQIRKMIEANKIPYHRLDPDQDRSRILINKRELDASILLGKNILLHSPTSTERKRIGFLISDD